MITTFTPLGFFLLIIVAAALGCWLFSALSGAHRDSRMLRATLATLSKRMDDVNSGMDHLNSADKNIGTAVTTAINTFKDLASHLGDPDADVEAIAGDIQSKADELNAIFAAPIGTTPAPVLTATPSTLGVSVGNSAAIATQNPAGALTFASADPTIATVDGNGNVTGVLAGSTSISITDGTTTVSVAVTVS